jgi:hypothetical protein
VALFTTSVRATSPSSRGLDDGGPSISCMDIVAVIFGVVMFAILFALVAGIDRI